MMNITDVRLITKPQSPISDQYSSCPDFVMPYDKHMQDIIAAKHIHGRVSIFDLAITYNTSAKKVKEYIKNYSDVSTVNYYEHKDAVLNLSKQCGANEIANRLNIPVVAVGNIIKGLTK